MSSRQSKSFLSSHRPASSNDNIYDNDDGSDDSSPPEFQAPGITQQAQTLILNTNRDVHTLFILKSIDFNSHSVKKSENSINNNYNTDGFDWGPYRLSYLDHFIIFPIPLIIESNIINTYRAFTVNIPSSMEPFARAPRFQYQDLFKEIFMWSRSAYIIIDTYDQSSLEESTKWIDAIAPMYRAYKSPIVIVALVSKDEEKKTTRKISKEDIFDLYKKTRLNIVHYYEVDLNIDSKEMIMFHFNVGLHRILTNDIVPLISQYFPTPRDTKQIPLSLFRNEKIYHRQMEIGWKKTFASSSDIIDIKLFKSIIFHPFLSSLIWKQVNIIHTKSNLQASKWNQSQSNSINRNNQNNNNDDDQDNNNNRPSMEFLYFLFNHGYYRYLYSILKNVGTDMAPQLSSYVNAPKQYGYGVSQFLRCNTNLELYKLVKKCLLQSLIVDHINITKEMDEICISGSLEILEYAYKSHPDTHLCSQNGLTYAISFGHIEMVRFIINHMVPNNLKSKLPSEHKETTNYGRVDRFTKSMLEDMLAIAVLYRQHDIKSFLESSFKGSKSIISRLMSK